MCVCACVSVCVCLKDVKRIMTDAVYIVSLFLVWEKGCV